jgi:hypothetical protein
MTIDEAGLATIRTSLEADGYRLDVEERGERLAASVSATEQACEDCLVPKDLMKAMMEQALGVPAQAIDLTYPGEAETA